MKHTVSGGKGKAPRSQFAKKKLKDVECKELIPLVSSVANSGSEPEVSDSESENKIGDLRQAQQEQNKGKKVFFYLSLYSHQSLHHVHPHEDKRF